MVRFCVRLMNMFKIHDSPNENHCTVEYIITYFQYVEPRIGLNCVNLHVVYLVIEGFSGVSVWHGQHEAPIHKISPIWKTMPCRPCQKCHPLAHQQRPTFSFNRRGTERRPSKYFTSEINRFS